MHPHDSWLELAALDALGELKPDEQRGLEEHLRDCAECRAAAAGAADVVRTWLPLASAVRRVKDSAAEERERRDAFLARARLTGLRFSDAAAQHPRPWAVWAARWNTAPIGAAAAAALLILVTGVVVSSLPSGQAPVPSAGGRETETPGRLADLARDVKSLRAELDASRHRIEAGQVQLADLQQQGQQLRQRAEALEQQLAGTRDREAAARKDAQRAQAEASDASQRLDAERRQLEALRAEVEHLAGLRAQLERVEAAHAADQALLAARQEDVAELNRQVRLQAANVERARELLAADRDIRDLMSARNLHIVDVRDTDARGKTRKAFGRVFYTEGKSLIFYAYDLEPTRLQNAAFQVWGAKTGAETRAVSLGMLFSDDQHQSRWMMKFDDPKVLREIDSVFVTVERPGGSKAPSSQRMLYAYLLNEANHR